LKLARLTSALVATLAAVAVIAAPASARSLTQARATCPDNSLCVFEHANWDGKWVSSRSRINNLEYFGFNDKTTSYLNDSRSRFCMYEHKNTGFTSLGFRITVNPWAYSTNVGPRYNDQITSVLRSDDPFRC
jgi:hypothetical protein